MEEIRESFIQGLSRISYFWGFPKAMGAIYGVIYLSSKPISLNEIVSQVGISKGAVSTNVRSLERWAMIHKHIKVGDRKDYYEAETDFWKIIKNILKEREKNEFDLAIKKVTESLDMLKNETVSKNDEDLKDFYGNRMEQMREFFNTLDKIVSLVLTMDSLKSGFFRKKSK